MSYSEPPPPPPQYGAPVPPAGGMPPTNSGKAVASLVLGIVGLICSGCLVLSILAIVFGVLAKNEIRDSGGAKKGAGMAQAGFILGIVGIVLAIGYWILVATGAIDVSYSTS